MRKRGRILCALPLAALFCALALWAAPETRIKVMVKTLSGRPVDRAEVILRWKASAKHARAGFGSQFESRSDQDGLVSFPAVPQGSIQIQVNAKGYQTFGQIYDVKEEEKTIEIKLNPPQQQYSSH